MFNLVCPDNTRELSSVEGCLWTVVPPVLYELIFVCDVEGVSTPFVAGFHTVFIDDVGVFEGFGCGSGQTDEPVAFAVAFHGQVSVGKTEKEILAPMGVVLDT
jgi:hypothetical protein